MGISSEPRRINELLDEHLQAKEAKAGVRKDVFSLKQLWLANKQKPTERKEGRGLLLNCSHAPPEIVQIR